jgi:hypothetical protein
MVRVSKFPRVVIFLFVPLFFLAGAGAVYQIIGEWRDACGFPPRGRSVDIGGLLLKLNCSDSARPL